MKPRSIVQNESRRILLIDFQEHRARTRAGCLSNDLGKQGASYAFPTGHRINRDGQDFRLICGRPREHEATQPSVGRVERRSRER